MIRGELFVHLLLAASLLFSAPAFAGSQDKTPANALVSLSNSVSPAVDPLDQPAMESSDSFVNPVFTTPETFRLEDDSEPDWSKDFLRQYSDIRIKVFPHNSKYNSPQGKDTVIDRVTVSSAGSCNVYKAEKASSEGGITRSQLLKTGSSFNLSVQNVTDPMWIECDAPVQVTRADYASAPIRYKGVLFVKKTNTTSPYLTLVNVLPFEEYLKGVVPSEMPASWASEALKAQAIAARTYAFYELTTFVSSTDPNLTAEDSGAQFDDTVTYQAYLGLKNTTAATDKAVDATAGQVMVHQGKVVKAYFHADSGGYTENAENVWDKYYPYIIAKPEIYPAGSIPGTDWSYTYANDEIEKRLVANKLISASQDIVSLRIEKDDHFPSSRPSFITLVLTGNVTKKIRAVDFSFAMKIKSAWITVNSKGSSTSINGKGFGHGAGMNQWGARVMVDKFNKTFDEILKFYYTGIEIVKDEQ
jgi:stage II sporulation protein D